MIPVSSQPIPVAADILYGQTGNRSPSSIADDSYLEAVYLHCLCRLTRNAALIAKPMEGVGPNLLIAEARKLFPELRPVELDRSRVIEELDDLVSHGTARRYSLPAERLTVYRATITGLAADREAELTPRNRVAHGC